MNNIRKYQLLSVFVLVFVINAVCSAADMNPPSVQMLFPKPGTVITGNTVKLSASVADSQSGIRRVRFIVEYVTIEDKKEKDLYGYLFGAVYDTVFSITDNAPYEAVWNCSHVPDQDLWRLTFRCSAEDSAGNECVSEEVSFVVLDRKKKENPEIFRSEYVRNKIEFDGKLDEWSGFSPESLQFNNGNNSITVYSCWDKRFLYFGIRILDAQIYSSREIAKDEWQPWLNDEIELFFDVNNTRSSMRDETIRQFVISAMGFCYQVGFDLHGEPQVTVDTLDESFCKVRVLGTLNHSADEDTAWIMEVRVPWDRLGVDPAAGTVMGFDIFNTDQELEKGGRVFASWAGTERTNNNNPSEWGKIVLVKRSKRYGILLIILAGILAGIIVFTRRRSKDGPAEKKEIKTPREIHVQRIKTYIKEHCHEENMSVGVVAEAIGLNKDYLSRIFKEVTGERFSAYLNGIRIEKAKELLVANPGESITDIAFDSGYKTLEHFVRVFKSRTGFTPKEFRNKHLGGI